MRNFQAPDTDMTHVRRSLGQHTFGDQIQLHVYHAVEPYENLVTVASTA